MQTLKSTATSTTGVVPGISQYNPRVQFYVLLARLLYTPPDNTLFNFLEEIGNTSLPSEYTDSIALQDLLAVCKQISSIESLDDEFHALFIGIGQGELIPYASWYIKGALMESPLAELRNTLAILGFERQDDVSEPEDHVAAVLETMALIINDANDANGVSRQKAFFEQHISPWVGHFFSDLEQSPSAAFYRQVAAFGKYFLNLESRLLCDYENQLQLN